MGKELTATVGQIRKVLTSYTPQQIKEARGSSLGWALLEIVKKDKFQAQIEAEGEGDPSPDNGGPIFRAWENALDWDAQLIICRYAQIARALPKGKKLKDSVRISKIGIVR